jgi:6-phosphogluconate dehydrogenase-like protein
MEIPEVNIGFVGLGAMGALIAPRLMAAGHAVTGWNRSRDKAKPLIDAGMRFADTPRAVAEKSKIVFSIVTDAAAVRTVALGPDGVVAGLRTGCIYIDMSTIDPDASRRRRRVGGWFAGGPVHHLRVADGSDGAGARRHRRGLRARSHWRDFGPILVVTASLSELASASYL